MQTSILKCSVNIEVCKFNCLQFKLNIELRQENNKAMNSLRSINTYRGMRNAQGLPVRGQSSKSNAKTQRKRRRVGTPSSILLKKGGA